jgi:hypothetical protein
MQAWGLIMSKHSITLKEFLERQPDTCREHVQQSAMKLIGLYWAVYDLQRGQAARAQVSRWWSLPIAAYAAWNWHQGLGNEALHVIGWSVAIGSIAVFVLSVVSSLRYAWIASA